MYLYRWPFHCFLLLKLPTEKHMCSVSLSKYLLGLWLVTNYLGLLIYVQRKYYLILRWRNQLICLPAWRHNFQAETNPLFLKKPKNIRKLLLKPTKESSPFALSWPLNNNSESAQINLFSRLLDASKSKLVPI